MQKRLKKIYFSLLIPATAGFIGAYLFRYVHQPPLVPARLMTVIAPTLFILTVVFAVAGPIFLRAFFAHRQQDHFKTPQTALYKFEKMLIGISMIAPYLALVAYCLYLPRFHMACMLLVALYAVYYYYPSAKRLALDENIYRVA
jgi:hypothetical protein